MKDYIAQFKGIEHEAARTAVMWETFKNALAQYDARRDMGLITAQHFSMAESVAALGNMIEYAKGRGWRFVSLDECLRKLD